MSKSPVLFLAHGSPLIAIQENEYTQFLREFADKLPAKPKAFVVFTAHWEVDGNTRITFTDGPHDTVHDFGPWWMDELFEVEYPAKGNKELAARISHLLQEQGIASDLDPVRGLDHGTWSLLKQFDSEASTPVVQLSVNPNLSARDQYKIGQAIRELQDEGILIIGSGVTVHNLSLHSEVTEAWALEFDDWIIDKIENKDYETLFNYAEEAPHAALAVPTPEHFVPLLIALGSADPNHASKVIYRDYTGLLSYLSLQL
ncbi:dioxygenase [Paenibacillus selenitireducens]|uniref:Dioxygenase n=1 Tax=Paenibacillus selenitireducens TaxID=1324314 RepID=A0A1T2X5U8_9BACL|nr:class III extradiol ring-cleavage dioxygenase [Paenibacillus selenitireducens]OPA75271.1 dioxygenase [Paenibacillus selenitireducens]